jgi:hypothetical protein
MKNREEKDEIGSINKFDKVRLADQMDSHGFI